MAKSEDSVDRGKERGEASDPALPSLPPSLQDHAPVSLRLLLVTLRSAHYFPHLLTRGHMTGKETACSAWREWVLASFLLNVSCATLVLDRECL